MDMFRTLCGAGISLLLWTSISSAQRPSDADSTALIERSRKKTLEYARSLPDFVCTEVIQRYSQTPPSLHWFPVDKLTIKLSYFQQKEEHKLTLINDQPTIRDFTSIQGAVGAGEFAGTLRAVFEPVSEATFRWDSWKTSRRRRVAVFSYVVPMAHSHYSLMNESADGMHQAIVGYHGMLEIDVETGEVLRFTYQADHIPRALTVESALTEVEYSLVDVGGRDYLLPTHSQTEMHSPYRWRRNTMEFQDYRKYSADSSISFGVSKF